MAAQSKTEQPVAPPSYNEAVNGSASNVSSSIDLPDNFEGTVEVNDDPPNKYDIEKCRDLVVLDGNGESHPFSSLYAGEGMAKRHLIIFVRHFFCGNCQEYLRALCRSIVPNDMLTLEKPTFISVVGCGRPELIQMYRDATECPYPIYADPSKQLYDYLGMTRTLDMGKKPDYISSSFTKNVLQSMGQVVTSGNNAFKGGDLKQVGGEFLFEDGKVIWCHRMRHTRDHSEIPRLREVCGLPEEPTLARKSHSNSIKDLGRRSSSWGRHSSMGSHKKEKTPEVEK